jgi:CRP-like cAMP-binding protein
MTTVTLKLHNGTNLSAEDGVLLEALFTNRRFIEPRDDIVRDGEPAGEVRVILEGFACRYKLMPGGKRVITAYLLPGDFCNLHVPLLGKMDHSVGALMKCSVADLHQSDVLNILDSRPRIARALWWTTLVDEAISREWLANIGRRSADKKLAHLLCELRLRLENVGLATQDSMTLPLTHDELADTLGISTVHVSRVLQQLKSDNLVATKGREFLFPDLRKLEIFGEFRCDYLHLDNERSATHRTESRFIEPSIVTNLTR